jgi:hypothetical protein
MTEELSPAEYIAQAYAKMGVPIEQARDLVIRRCLQYGDATAFSYFVLAGHQPGREVLRDLAFITTGAMKLPAEVATAYPFGLKAKRRAAGVRGPRHDPLVAMRDEIQEVNVLARMKADNLKREAATGLVAEMISGKDNMEKGRSRKFETVRKSRKRQFTSVLGK